MPANTQLIDDDVPRTPPTDSAECELERQYEWLFRRFTAPEWDVSEFHIETNDHAETDATAFEGALSHESGSLVQLLPFDPEAHQREAPIFHATRVRLRDATEDTNHYITVAEPTDEWASAPFPREEFLGKRAHPRSSARKQIVAHEQAAVHDEDDLILETDGGARGYALTTAKETVLAVFGATQSVTKQKRKQAGLEGFL
ncbi:hypothetical protein ACOZ4L_16675 (plasmid) [Haloplanus ruber]|uniref:Uncharacterized protein n=1 Tax=Haloplanus ruber TaxID=869892 RepID=A0ABD6D4F6_9EURY|nr:hypothetical protein [Haloplanus ruber]